MRPLSRRAVLFSLAGGALLALGGCQAQPASQVADHQTKPAGLSPFTGLAPGATFSFPSFVSAEVRDGYQFAVERPDVLKWLPCYCGCGLTSGHKSNLDCFIAGSGKDGVVFDEHASYCQTCLDIARDAKRLVAQGDSLPAIRAYVDRVHGSKGPGTDTPRPSVPPGAG